MSKVKTRNIVITKAVNFSFGETQSLDVLHKQAITSLRSITRQIRALKLASDKFPALKLSTSLESSIKDWSNTSCGEKPSLLRNKLLETPDEFDDDAWTAIIPELSVINLRRSLKLDVSCQQSIQELVNCLRDWRMELEDAKYKDTDFDAPLTPWSKKDRIAIKEEITVISLEQRKKNIGNKLNKANQYQRDNKGNPARMNLVKQMVDLLVQEIFLLRIMPFEEVVYPLTEKDVYCWERVSKALNGSHTPAECSEFWYTKLHPSLNDKSWSETENKALVALTEEFNMQHWDKVSKFLYTGRTPFQCYVQFRRFLYKQKPFDNLKSNKHGGKKGVGKNTRLTDVVDATMTAITTAAARSTRAVNAKRATNAKNATSATVSANSKDANATSKAKDGKATPKAKDANATAKAKDSNVIAKAKDANATTKAKDANATAKAKDANATTKAKDANATSKAKDANATAKAKDSNVMAKAKDANATTKAKDANAIAKAKDANAIAKAKDANATRKATRAKNVTAKKD